MNSGRMVVVDDPRDALLDELVQIQKRRSAMDAREQEVIASLAELAPDGVDPASYQAKEWVREEIACALSFSPRTAACRLHDAVTLVQRFPATLAAMRAGTIGILHARALLEGTRPVSDQVAAAVQARVLARAEGKTVGSFRQHVKRAVLSLDTRTMEAQERDSLSRRRVVFVAQDSCTTDLYATLSAEGAAALDAALQRLAEAAGADDERTVDQRRADALSDLARGSDSGSGHGRSGPSVQVIVAASTLLGLDDQPGELAGHGPVPASVARRIADDPSGTWRRLLTDPAGQIVDYGRSTYRPPAPLANLVRARDRTCRFPGCTKRAERCDLDHREDWDRGGTTCADNLHPLCERHHYLTRKSREATADL